MARFDPEESFLDDVPDGGIDDENVLDVALSMNTGPRYGRMLNFRWGVGNKLLLFSSPSPVAVKESKGNAAVYDTTGESTLAYEVDWEPALQPEYRKLLLQSHGTFAMLQDDARQSGGLSQGQLLQYSRLYRSVMRESVRRMQKAFDVDGGDEDAAGLIELAKIKEGVWHMCEIFFINHAPNALAQPFFADWVRWNAPAVGYSHISAASITDDNAEYWRAVSQLIVQGRTEESRALLSHRGLRVASQFNRDAATRAAAIDEILRKFPRASSTSVPSEFLSAWTRWHEECVARRELFADDARLYGVWQILTGDLQAIEREGTGWTERLCAVLLYAEPSVKLVDSPSLARRLAGRQGGLVDATLLAVLEYDVHQVLRNLSHFADRSFIAHLIDLLVKSGGLPPQQLDYGSDLREFFLLEYGASLAALPGLWGISADYLSSCPVYGKHFIERTLERVSPTDSEMKAKKIMRIASNSGANDVARSVARVFGALRLSQGRHGSALGWYLKINDVAMVTALADRMMDKYYETGSFDSLDMLDGLGEQMALSERLVFLAKYRELHRHYEEGDFRRAGDLLVRLFTSNLAPKRFWLTLLVDAVPLLESPDVVFDSLQTYELQRCLTELELSHMRDVYLSTDAVSVPAAPAKFKGNGVAVSSSAPENASLQDERVSVIRLALVRNLSRAIVMGK
eukprot:Opistho-2@19292